MSLFFYPAAAFSVLDGDHHAALLFIIDNQWVIEI